jgi:hypothetical protein
MKTPNPNQEVLNLKKKIDHLETRMIKYCSPITDKIRELEDNINNICIHNDTERKDEYEDGSYYDQCKYITKIICKDCGKELKKDVKYGGFN